MIFSLSAKKDEPCYQETYSYGARSKSKPKFDADGGEKAQGINAAPGEYSGENARGTARHAPLRPLHYGATAAGAISK